MKGAGPLRCDAHEAEHRAILAHGAPQGWRKWRAIRRLLIALLVPPAAIATAFQLQPTYVVLDFGNGCWIRDVKDRGPGSALLICANCLHKLLL